MFLTLFISPKKFNSMRQLSLFAILFLLFCYPSLAQEFDQAPAKNVKSITEWVLDKGKGKTTKGYHYQFNPKGALVSYNHADSKESVQCNYFSDGKISQKITEEDQEKSTTSYAYKWGHWIEETKEETAKYKTVNYLNKRGQVTEKKAFVMEFGKDKNYRVLKRNVYHYDNTGRLLGEMIYDYPEDFASSKSYKNKKTIHYYKTGTTQLLKTEEFNENAALSMVYSFTYNEAGQVQSEKATRADGSVYYEIDYEYKDGNLLQKKYDSGTYDETYVYKDGAPVRKKWILIPFSETVVDFQYEYF